MALMTITMSKIGTILDSRPMGREAWLGMRPSLPKGADESVIVDFTGVNLLTPSFADEYITSLLETYPKQVTWVNVKPGSIIEKTLQFLLPEWKERGLIA